MVGLRFDLLEAYYLCTHTIEQAPPARRGRRDASESPRRKVGGHCRVPSLGEAPPSARRENNVVARQHRGRANDEQTCRRGRSAAGHFLRWPLRAISRRVRVFSDGAAADLARRCSFVPAPPFRAAPHGVIFRTLPPPQKPRPGSIWPGAGSEHDIPPRVGAFPLALSSCLDLAPAAPRGRPRGAPGCFSDRARSRCCGARPRRSRRRRAGPAPRARPGDPARA